MKSEYQISCAFDFFFFKQSLEMLLFQELRSVTTRDSVTVTLTAPSLETYVLLRAARNRLSRIVAGWWSSVFQRRSFSYFAKGKPTRNTKNEPLGFK